MSGLSDIQEVPQEFQRPFMIETETFLCCVDSDTGNSELLTYVKNDKSVHRKRAHIWKNDNPTQSSDYWYRLDTFNQHIIFQDYEGIKIYSPTLSIVFRIDISSEEKYLNVLGCEIIDRKLLVWNTGQANFDDIVSDHNMWCENEKERIDNDLKAAGHTKKQRKEMILNLTKHIKRVHMYECISPCLEKFVYDEHVLPDSMFDDSINNTYCANLASIEMSMLEELEESKKSEKSVDLLGFEQLQNNDKLKMHIFVNTDLNMKKGKIASQVGHIAGLITEKIIRSHYESNETEHYNKYMNWISNGHPKIVKKATYLELLELMRLPNSLHVIDEGLTQIKPGSLTVVGFYPDSSMAKEFGKYKLL